MVTEMTRKLPKYVRIVKGARLRYQRDYPTLLQKVIGKKTFTYPLKVAVGAPDSEINKSVLDATRAFELAVKMAQTSDPESFGLAELDLAALEYLRRNNLQPAQFLREELSGDDLQRLQAGSEDYVDRFTLAEDSLPDFHRVYMRTKEGLSLSFEDKVVNLAWSKLVDRLKASPRTLNQLWEEYFKDKWPDPTKREAIRDAGRWSRWIAEAGDAAVSSDTLNHIHDGLDRFVQKRSLEVKQSSIKRDMNVVISALRKASRKYRFGWVIEPPPLSQEPSKQKKVLTRENQRVLVEHCYQLSDKRQQMIASVVLVMLQCGGMPTEVLRLKEDSVDLSSSIPYLVIKGVTKTRMRPRIVPIVLGKSFLGKHLNEAIQWMSSLVDPSAAINNFLGAVFKEGSFTGHCLRHTFEVNSQSVGAHLGHVALIGGWSGNRVGVSEVMLDYGAEGLRQSEILSALHDTSVKIHAHLLQV